MCWYAKESDMNSNTTSDCTTAKLRWKNIGNIIYPKKETYSHSLHSLEVQPEFYFIYRVMAPIYQKSEFTGLKNNGKQNSDFLQYSYKALWKECVIKK